MSSRALIVGAVVLLSSAAGLARAQGEGAAPQAPRTDEPGEASGARALSVAEVVSLAQAHNPSLKAALKQLESARWDIFGSEAMYDPVLALDATGSQITTVTVTRNAERRSIVRRGEAGAEIRKHLLWGTDLALRLSTGVQKSDLKTGQSIPMPVPSMGMGTLGGLDLSSFGQIFGFGAFGPIYNLSAKLSLKQPLWRGRGRDVGEAAMREARLQRTASEYAHDRVSSELLRDVLTSYWELWYADEALSIQQQARLVAARQRDEAAARAQSGSLAPAEVLTFETQVATRDEDVLTARNERERRSHELARLLGENEREASYGAQGEPALDERSFTRVDIEQAALAESAELHERQAAVELARLRQKTADDPNKPRLDVDGYVQTQGYGNRSYRNAGEMFVSGDALSALLSLTYEAPVRDRVRRAEAAKARLATEVAEEQLRETRQRVLAEVRAALDRERSGRERVALSEQTAEIAARQLAAEEARYRTGSATSLAVLEAEDRVRGARLRLARARADHAESVLAIEHLTGELLARHAH